MDWCIGNNYGSSRFRVIALSIKDDSGKEIPATGCGAFTIKGGWCWRLIFKPCEGKRMVIEARVSFGHGEYQVKTVLVKNPQDRYYVSHGQRYQIVADPDAGGWALADDESEERWIPPKGWKGEK